MKQLIFFLLLILSLSLGAETFRGYIFDEKRNPLQDALVVHGNNSAVSQENGYFLLNSKSEADSLIVYLAFYDIQRIHRKEFTSTKHITLTSKSMMLEPFTFTAKKSNNLLPSSQEKITISLKDKSTSTCNVAEVLTQEKSIQIEGTQLPGERQTASILGHSSRHTLVMLDGIPLNTSGEDFDLASIPAEIVDEIEIYKNNTSSLSGGGGIAGVINIKTKKSTKNRGETSLNLNYGSYNFKKLSLVNGFTLGRTTFYGVLTGQSSDNDFKYKIKKGNQWHTETRDNNKKKSMSAMVNLTSKLAWFDIYYSGNVSQYDNQLPGPTNKLSNFNGASIEGYDLYQELKLQKRISKVTNTLQVYHLNKKSEYQNLNSTLPHYKANNISRNQRIGVKLSNVIDLDKLELSLTNSGLEESYSFAEKIKLADSIEKSSQHSYASSLVGQYRDSFSLFNYNLISSVRYDKHNEFNDFTTYRVSGDLSYDYIIKPTLLLSYGTSFTIPSFYSLYWKGDSQALGNPDLQPEESKGYQIGLKLEYATAILKFNHSFNKIDNLIQWIEVTVPSGAWKPVNIGSSEIGSYEIEFNWEVMPKLNLFARTVFSETKNKTRLEDGSPSSFYGKKLVYIPDYIINIGANYSYRNYQLKVEYNKTGKQWVTPDNLSSQLPAYELLNTAFSRSFITGKFEHKVNLRLNNLLNNYYEIVRYNPQAPFNWSLGYGLKYRL